jgi:hypothetical protein
VPWDNGHCELIDGFNSKLVYGFQREKPKEKRAVATWRSGMTLGCALRYRKTNTFVPSKHENNRNNIKEKLNRKKLHLR